MKIYVAGPMRSVPQFGFPAFDAARDSLRVAGHEVVSPADLDRAAGYDVAELEKLSAGELLAFGRDAIRRDVEAILDGCHAVVVLPGWEASRGAAVEVALALFLGLPVYRFSDGRRLAVNVDWRSEGTGELLPNAPPGCQTSRNVAMANKAVDDLKLRLAEPPAADPVLAAIEKMTTDAQASLRQMNGEEGGQAGQVDVDAANAELAMAAEQRAGASDDYLATRWPELNRRAMSMKFWKPPETASAFPLIAFTGYAGSGKDEAAKALTELGWRRVAFADAVREAALAIDPIVLVGRDERERIRGCAALLAGGIGVVSCGNTHLRLSSLVKYHGWDGAKQAADVRRLLQRLGTEAGRDIHGEDCWVKIAAAKIAAAQREGAAGVVITDARFPNEVNFVRSRGGFIVRVTRPGVGPVNGHISDAGIESIAADDVIANAGDVADLHDAVRACLQRLGLAPRQAASMAEVVEA